MRDGLSLSNYSHHAVVPTSASSNLLFEGLCLIDQDLFSQ